TGSAAVAMEDPYIPLFRSVVRQGGSEVLPLPVDDDGACVDILDGPDLAGVRAAVVTPSHQYPIGSTLHPARRQALAEWARAGRAGRPSARGGRPRQGLGPAGSAAGLHALIRLEPVGLTEAEVVDRAAGYDLAIEGLGDLWQVPTTAGDAPDRPQGIVVGFGSPTESGYPAALDALVRTLSWG